MDEAVVSIRSSNPLPHDCRPRSVLPSTVLAAATSLEHAGHNLTYIYLRRSITPPGAGCRNRRDLHPVGSHSNDEEDDEFSFISIRSEVNLLRAKRVCKFMAALKYYRHLFLASRARIPVSRLVQQHPQISRRGTVSSYSQHRHSHRQQPKPAVYWQQQA